MFRYTSNVTFLYYNDLKYGSNFFENILNLPMVMDQGFAKIYQVNKTSFLGIVQLKNFREYKGDTLVSLNTKSVKDEYLRISNSDIYDLTEIIRLDQIPLDSFFFKDKEGHKFEIQEFLSSKDKLVF